MKSSFTKLIGSAVFLMLVAYALIALQGPQGVPGLMEKRRLIHEYEKKNSDIARQIEQQRARIGRFSDNSTKQELEIRDRLKLLKPGEKTFILQDASATPASPTASK